MFVNHADLGSFRGAFLHGGLVLSAPTREAGAGYVRPVTQHDFTVVCSFVLSILN